MTAPIVYAQSTLFRSSRPIWQQYAEFDAANPWVYDALVRLARQAKRRGATKIGMAMLFEVLRWDTSLSTQSWDGFKLNNSYRAFYAREIMAKEADLKGVFETRTQKAA